MTKAAKAKAAGSASSGATACNAPGRGWDDLIPAEALGGRLPASGYDLLTLLPGYDPVKTGAGCRFDPHAAEAALRFFPEHLRHVEGGVADQPFVLERWQQSFVANLFGWKRLDSKGRVVRRYREALLYVPRKNGKTPLVAGLALLVFFADNEAGQQGYVAAGDREQAGLLFRHCRGMVERNRELSARCKVYGGGSAAGHSKSLVRESDGSFLRVISADAEGKHGGNTHLAIVDELHVQPDRELVDVLTTSMASANRKQPLMVYITTADYARPSICNEVYAHAKNVLDNPGDPALPGYSPSFLPAVFEAGPDDPWDDERVWSKANPNLGVSVSVDYLREACAKAKDNPALENTFRRLHLNQQTQQDVRAIPMDLWVACGSADPLAWRARALEALKRRPCVGGLDLGSTGDLTALALLFRGKGAGEPEYTVLPYFWVPRESARRRTKKDRVPYEVWIAQGYVIPTRGDTTDYQQVRQDVNDLAGLYGVEELAVDRTFQGAQLCTELMQDGFQVVAYGQSMLNMAFPARRLLELLAQGQIAHGGNPVLHWMAGNAAAESDGAGSMKFSKKKSTERIDGVTALAMALGRAMLRESGEPEVTLL